MSWRRAVLAARSALALFSLTPLAACSVEEAGPADLSRPADLARRDLAEELLEPDMAGDMAVAVPRSFDEIRDLVLRPRCASFPQCHSARGAMGASGLDLETDPFGALTGVTAKQPGAAAEGLALVEPCAPERSFLWIKVDLRNPRHQGKRYGSPMPLDRPAVPEPQRQALREWIARGAPRQEGGGDGGGDGVCGLDGGVPDGG